MSSVFLTICVITLGYSSCQYIYVPRESVACFETGAKLEQPCQNYIRQSDIKRYKISPERQVQIECWTVEILNKYGSRFSGFQSL